MNCISISALPWEEQRSPAGKFHSFARNVSLALGGIRNAGPSHGGHPFDLQVRRIPPGASVCPFHSHLAQWEFFLVRSGTGTVRAGSETHAIKAGDCFVHPPGEPHQLINSGTTDLEVFVIADNPPLDAFYYPDSDKWGLRPPGKYFRLTEVGYFDGEEPMVPGTNPQQPSGAPAAPPLAPFSSRKLHVDDVPWEPWESPKKKFRAASKELSIALGAKRNTPAGLGGDKCASLGGHPFDLELNRLAPGQRACPFHAHSAQWELFWITAGTATVRADAARHTFTAGDIVLHPPGEAHEIFNASATEPLEFLLIADNPPVDYWHYPDSGKWGLRAPRKFFRMNEADYWDGEE